MEAAKEEAITRDIQVLYTKTDSLREIMLMTNKRIDYFRDMRSDTIALWLIAAALWVCAIKILIM